MKIASMLTAAALIAATLTQAGAADVTPAQARAIAKDAYIFGFPMVDNYRVVHAYFLDPQSPEYKKPPNQIASAANVYTPEDKAVQTPNSDTPYSYAFLDLRAEPIVLTVPAISKDRYYSVQLLDLYTHNFAYLGTRAEGNGGGNYLIAGPGWTGETPTGIAKVIRPETEFIFPVYRTQLFGPDDIENVKKIQAGYKIEPLSAYLKTKAPATAPEVNWPKPLTAQDQRTSPEFFNLLAFVLQFCPVNPADADLRASFAKVGVEPGKTINIAALSPDMRAALVGGMEDGQKEINAVRAVTAAAGDVLGARTLFNGDWVRRAVGAQMGIYGNSKEEAYYVAYQKEAAGQPYDASKKNYTLHFAPGAFPPVNAFWSMTMYDLPAQLLVANPINRYLINSPMLPKLKLDPDGGLTIYIQAENPGRDKESNWLPAPKSPFFAVMRLYYPKKEVLTGAWKVPPLETAN
ncbi:DUF1254 domain-containing protein [Bradyrhizobium sp. sGM-13]|uniref:DUF1254 domain-containing protein n=1 Tax=Bradyrhizobium sp. sGM-13 TaxID=2831781 RepID=UPI001BCEF64A|nr:DUF1254 domain-containing protein [Bradyrhizobium sp. sGM-13]